MTREEAKNQFLCNDLIDEIYDGFESRTCRSCKHFGDTDEDWNQEECPMSVIGNPDKEYCWNWRSKDD